MDLPERPWRNNRSQWFDLAGTKCSIPTAERV